MEKQGLFTKNNSSPIVCKLIEKLSGSVSEIITDIISIEEPLEISLAYSEKNIPVIRTVSITMRTPGNDEELALGFLFTENIIASYNNILSVKHIPGNSTTQNYIQVQLKENIIPQLNKSDRNFYTTSSCGVCGKSSIESIKTTSLYKKDAKKPVIVPLQTLYKLPDYLHKAQNNFSLTGGIHASGLFSTQGELILLREDVGRHNALDKLIGAALKNNTLPLSNSILVLSGRASFELVQKAAMAGIQCIASVGAPSSLAIELAEESGIALLGFLKHDRVNIYHLPAHITISGIMENKN